MELDKYKFNDCNVCINEDIYFRFSTHYSLYAEISFSMNDSGMWNSHIRYGYSTGGLSQNVAGYTFKTKEDSFFAGVEKLKEVINRHNHKKDDFNQKALKALEQFIQPEQLTLF